MNIDDIIELTPTQEDLIAGAEYASITLPWTFNRMMANTSSTGQNTRGLNIAKGIVAQEVLKREAIRRGADVELERKSYRDDDLFDLRLPIAGSQVRIDFKTVNYYTDYGNTRESFSKEFIVENESYPGPDWRKFLPMLVPHTQIGQDKEAYCFAIASSTDFRKDVSNHRTHHSITAYPYGKSKDFLSSAKLCLLREESGNGIFLQIRYPQNTLLNHNINLKVLGEWQGNKVIRTVEIIPNMTLSNIGPFSCVSSFQFDKVDFDNFNGTMLIDVDRNEFTRSVLNSQRRNVNVIPSEPMTLSKSDFCNLILPDNFKLYLIGWILKSEFLERCKKYPAYIWPNDKVNKFENQIWNQITTEDRKMLIKCGFEDRIVNSPPEIKAGFMKTHGRGGGACCFVFPNQGRGGGIREHNLYVLPSDLNTIDTLI